jgi:transketolase
MRKEFSSWIEQRASGQRNIVFLTGDLGFNALEGLQSAIGDRFINAGVSEQNMVSMAASLAQQGLSPFCYSIAPFCVFRPAEQIRVDVCLHNMNVKIVGNGGGYGYGIMGATHHAIEDIAVLSSFPNMKCFVPFSNDSVESTCNEMMKYNGPSYLRLGFGIAPDGLNDFKVYEPIQHLQSGSLVTILGLGPVILNAIAASAKSQISADIFVVNELPLKTMSDKVMESLRKTRKLLIVEEHVSRGGLGEHISLHLQKNRIALDRFSHHSARGYPNQSYGSQGYHQAQSGLDEDSISLELRGLVS